MNRSEIGRVVCDCLGQVAMAPAGMTQELCEQQSTKQMGLSDEDIERLFECILEQLHAHDCTALLGKTMWKSAEKVAEFCDGVDANHSCGQT